jgi:hypothetical protein
LEEAFLLQMDDFDGLLEIRLRLMLDGVVAGRPPIRRGRLKRTPLLAVVEAPFALAAGAIPVLEPIVVPVVSGS